MTRILATRTTRECIAREFKNQRSITQEFSKWALLFLRACIQFFEGIVFSSYPTLLTSLRNNFLCGISLIFLYCCTIIHENLHSLSIFSRISFTCAKSLLRCTFLTNIFFSEKYFPILSLRMTFQNFIHPNKIVRKIPFPHFNFLRKILSYSLSFPLNTIRCSAFTWFIQSLHVILCAGTIVQCNWTCLRLSCIINCPILLKRIFSPNANI